LVYEDRSPGGARNWQGERFKCSEECDDNEDYYSNSDDALAHMLPAGATPNLGFRESPGG